MTSTPRQRRGRSPRRAAARRSGSRRRSGARGKSCVVEQRAELSEQTRLDHDRVVRAGLVSDVDAMRSARGMPDCGWLRPDAPEVDGRITPGGRCGPTSSSSAAASPACAPRSTWSARARPDPHEGRSRREQHRLRAGRHRGGASAPTTRPTLHRADTLAAGDGLCDERPSTCWSTKGPRYVRELIDWGAAFDRGADGQPALGARRRAQRPPRAARARRHRPRDRPRAVGRASGGADGPVHARRAGDGARRSRTGVPRASRLRCDDGGRRGDRRAPRGAARDRRRRPGVPRDDEPGGRDRRRHRAGVSRRRARRRSRVRAVPSDRAERARARRASCFRKRCAAKARGWSTRAASAFMDALRPRRRSRAARRRRARHRPRAAANRARRCT